MVFRYQHHHHPRRALPLSSSPNSQSPAIQCGDNGRNGEQYNPPLSPVSVAQPTSTLFRLRWPFHLKLSNHGIVGLFGSNNRHQCKVPPHPPPPSAQPLCGWKIRPRDSHDTVHNTNLFICSSRSGKEITLLVSSRDSFQSAELLWRWTGE